MCESFDDMELTDDLLRGIYAYGFEKPSIVQQKAVLPMSKGGDIIVQSQSGTGKTATYTISVLKKLDLTNPKCQAVIMCPTRELSSQIYRFISKLGEFIQPTIRLCIGGTNSREDIAALTKGAQIVIGTPGRIFDMIHRRALEVATIKMVVLDEADEMLSRGFKDQIYDIFQFIPKSIQICLFSATIPNEMMEISTRFMKSPETILLKKDQLTLEGIRQFYVAIEKNEWKLETLCDLYETLTINQSIIYCNTRRSVDWLTDQMRCRDFPISSIHSDMEQRERDEIMQEFRSGATRVLITTDLLARGIDIQQISVVINFDIPTNRESYIHRIGRSGRYGRKGVAINFVCQAEVKMLRDIEEHYLTTIQEMPVNINDYF